MTPFKFPPPPPPPPKASSSHDTENEYTSQRGGHGRGRGDRGRDRGRGRGSFGRGRGSRGGNQHQQSGRGGWQNNGNVNASPPRHYQQAASQSPPMPHSSGTPFGPLGNPTFSRPALNAVQVPQVDPNALVQAISFMSTPAGMQTMAAFANHMTSANGATPCPQSPVLQSHPPQNHGSPPSVGSKKRKRDERQRQFEAKPKPQPVASAQQPGKKPPRAKCKAPPEVPSFGFALPPTSVSRPSASSAASSSSPKKKSRVHLGLSRREAVDESSEGEDIDEEAAFVTKCKVEGAVFEHNGESISLQTQAEVAAWIKDRRRQFPTQKRIEQKAEEAAAKRANELEFLRKIKGQPAREKSGDQQGPASKPAQKKKPPAEPNRNLEELRKKVKESLAKQKTVSLEPQPDPQVLDLGLGYATDTASESGLSVLSDSSILSSSSVLSSDAGSGSDADDSDAPPGAQSAKAPIAPVVVPPPAPKLALPKPKQEKNGICAHWKKHGKCRHGQNCKHSHPGDGKAKRVGLYERMVEQELEKADRLALDAIKYLGQNGFLG